MSSVCKMEPTEMKHKALVVLAIIISLSRIGRCCHCTRTNHEEKICRATYVGIVRLRSAIDTYHSDDRPQIIYDAFQITALIEGNFEFGPNNSIVLMTNMFTSACGSPLRISAAPEENVYFMAAYAYGREKVTFGLCDFVFPWYYKKEQDKKYFTKQNIASVCECLEKKKENSEENCSDKIVPHN